MNKKILVSITLLLAIVMLVTPLVAAKPGAQKTNEKFLYFKLVPTGETGEAEKMWRTPPSATAEDFKTSHTRGGVWIPGPDLTLWVDDAVYPADDPLVTMEYAATYDSDTVRTEEGLTTQVRVHDTITISYDGVVLGTLELYIKSVGSPSGYSGTVVGHGTGAFEDVKISAIDTVYPIAFDPVVLEFARIGTIKGWPGLSPA